MLVTELVLLLISLSYLKFIIIFPQALTAAWKSESSTGKHNNKKDYSLNIPYD